MSTKTRQESTMISRLHPRGQFVPRNFSRQIFSREGRWNRQCSDSKGKASKLVQRTCLENSGAYFSRDGCGFSSTLSIVRYPNIFAPISRAHFVRDIPLFSRCDPLKHPSDKPLVASQQDLPLEAECARVPAWASCRGHFWVVARGFNGAWGVVASQATPRPG